MDIQSIYPACLGFIFGGFIVSVWFNFRVITAWLSSQQAKLAMASLIVIASPFVCQILFQSVSQGSTDHSSGYVLTNSAIDILKGFSSYIAPFITFFLGRYGNFLSESRKRSEIIENLKDEIKENFMSIEKIQIAFKTQVSSSGLINLSLSSEPIDLSNFPQAMILLQAFQWIDSYYTSLDPDQLRDVAKNPSILGKIKYCYRTGNELWTSVQEQMFPSGQSLKKQPENGKNIAVFRHWVSIQEQLFPSGQSLKSSLKMIQTF
jgi:hypothetical protein